MSSSVRSGRVIEAALRKKGFRVDATRDHVYFYFLKLDGEDSKIFTKISHGMGNSSLSADLISKMSRQLRLTKSQFLELIDCTLSEEGYRETLETQGLVA